MKKPSHTGEGSGFLPAIVITLFVTGYLITAYLTLDDDPRRLPELVGFVTLVLLAGELFKCYQSRSSAMPILTTDPPATEDEAPPLKDIHVLLYLVGLAVGIYLVGFYIAVPVYLIAAITSLGNQPLRTAVWVSVPASLGIYVVFELMLEFRLFHGVFFS